MIWMGKAGIWAGEEAVEEATGALDGAATGVVREGAANGGTIAEIVGRCASVDSTGVAL